MWNRYDIVLAYEFFYGIYLNRLPESSMNNYNTFCKSKYRKLARIAKKLKTWERKENNLNQLSNNSKVIYMRLVRDYIGVHYTNPKKGTVEQLDYGD